MGDSTTVRGPPMPIPQLMPRPMPGDTDTTPLCTDTGPVSTDTDTPMPGTDSTTARGRLMPSPLLMLRPTLTSDTPDTPVSTALLSTDTDTASTDMADMDTPMAPDTLTTDKK